MKSAFVALTGRPSAGKSTLMNTLCGHKISIVSPVPQTTRNKVRGIYNDRRGQLVFLDTPGYFSGEKKFNSYMHDVLSGALSEADILLYLIDLSRPPGQEEELLAGLVKKAKKPLVIGLNKSDLPGADAAAANAMIDKFGLTGEKIVLSGLSGTNSGLLLDKLFAAAEEGEPFYPGEYYTDQDPAFRISEIIREKAILKTRQEVPHALYIEIADMEMREEGKRLWVRGFLCVQRESQKGILIGRGGAVIKAIVQEAQAELNGIFPYAVQLDFRVRVRPKWKNNDSLLKHLIR
ncbi:MAG: GTPase Era [Spirochaetales bacterium]|nr:GTPase Era [Spirochaetales bacterium]